MPSNRLNFVPGTGFINTAQSAVFSGQAEPITGTVQYTPLSPGDYFDMTDAEALGYSDTTVGTLLAGRYMWVQLDSAAVNSGNGQLVRGQLLFWKLGGATPYLVTNVEPAGSSMIAGIYLGTVASGTANVTPGNWFFMQAISPGRANVKFRATITNGAPAIGDAVYAANQGAGADAGLVDDGPLVTLANASQFAGRFIGVAETAPANGATSVIQIQKAGPGRI